MCNNKKNFIFLKEESDIAGAHTFETKTYCHSSTLVLQKVLTVSNKNQPNNQNALRSTLTAVLNIESFTYKDVLQKRFVEYYFC
jgi:hypothetical protein